MTKLLLKDNKYKIQYLLKFIVMIIEFELIIIITKYFEHLFYFFVSHVNEPNVIYFIYVISLNKSFTNNYSSYRKIKVIDWNQQTEQFYRKKKATNRNRNIIVMGDLNARTGWDFRRSHGVTT